MSMNKQGENGIGWTDYTWNPIAGCFHECRWEMPDGSEAICYAESVANGVARGAYREGFQHHYFHPGRLAEPGKLKTPSKIFLDSMSDLMGMRVPDEQIESVLDVVRNNQRHTFQLLTKNTPRLLKFELPDNLWVGVSTPPTYMRGHKLTEMQQHQFMWVALKVLNKLTVPVRWISAEPLSLDLGLLLSEWWMNADNERVFRGPSTFPFEWLVVGAASSGKKTFQPNPYDVQGLLTMCAVREVPVYMKDNLDWPERRVEFPPEPVQALQQGRLF